jgi:hypothetical protein
MRRTMIGIIALALLAIGAILFFVPGDQAYAWMGACLRVGPVMCLLWLAWPQLSRIHPWLIFAALAATVVLLIFAKNPRIWAIALLILLVVARLRPGQRDQGTSQSSSRKPGIFR